jgi:tetratricopeptide (TPR) repeat protein
MTPARRSCLVVPVLLFACTALFAQTDPGGERPGVNSPTKVRTQQDLDHLEALKLYGQGLLYEKEHRLLDALKAYEHALRLDPDAASLHRAVIPIYLALDRTDDALAEFRRVIELDPADMEALYLYARQLRAQNKPKEATAVLKKATAKEALKEHANLRAQIFDDLATLYEDAGDGANTVKALRELAVVLDNPEALTEDGPITADEVKAQAALTWERIGRLCVKAGQAEKAITAFENARKKDPNGGRRLAYNLAELNEKQGKFREALEQVNDYLRMQPQGVEGYEMKVRLLRQLDREGDILPQLGDASKADPHNTALKLLLARETRRTQPAQAEALYRELIKDSPSPEAFKGLLAVYKDAGDDGARRLLQEFDKSVRAADKTNPAGGDAAQASVARGLLVATREDAEMVRRMLGAAEVALRGQPKLAPPTRTLLAVLAARTRQLPLAEKLYRSLLNDGNVPRDMEAEVYSGLLTVLWQSHKYDEVLALCDQGLKKTENTSRVLFHLDRAEALLALGKPDDAVAAAEAAVKDSKEKDRLLTRRTLAQTLSQAGKHEKALAECEVLLKEYNLPGDVRTVRVTLSSVYLAAHKYDESEKQLQLVLEADPNDALANNDLGYQWADRSKNLEEAERMIRKALELDRKARAEGGPLGPDADRDNAAYVDSLGWVLFRRGQLAAAREQLELAVSLSDGADDPTVWDHLGDVYFREEEKAKALAAWKKALGLFETNRRRADDRKKDVEKKIKLLES